MSVFSLCEKAYDKSVIGMSQSFRNELLLQDDCRQAPDTDKFFKQPSKCFDMHKKDFECELLVEEATESVLVNPRTQVSKQEDDLN